jgi:predicted metal-dependent hydrolase
MRPVSPRGRPKVKREPLGGHESGAAGSVGAFSLLRYTLDLFEPIRGEEPVAVAPVAPKNIVNALPSQPFVAGQPLHNVIAPVNYAHPKANREVRLEGAVVAYAFARGKRRTIGFAVGPDGLSVRAPRWTPLHEVDAALQEKASWILRKLDETRERQTRQEHAQVVWQEGAVIPYLGSSIRIALDGAHGFSAKGAQLDDTARDDGITILRIGLPHTATESQIRDAVQAWLMREAKANFVGRLDYFAPQLGVRWVKMSLSNAGTRWGSAKSDGSIRLNWRLIHFRQAVIDYVVVHELSHLRVMDHSPRFWDTVRSVVPDYAELRGSLKDPAIPKW